MIVELTDQTFYGAVEELAAADPDLAQILADHGPPPFYAREPGFPTLVLMILEQQVSLASARAAFDKLVAVVGELTPASLLAQDDETLRAAGFSRQKSRYSRILAEAILAGDLDLAQLHTLNDQGVHDALTALTGIGSWTAQVYLLMCLRRPDIWPAGDLALQAAIQTIKGLDQRPTAAETLPIAEAWQPWRAVAARLLWHDYLSK